MHEGQIFVLLEEETQTGPGLPLTGYLGVETPNMAAGSGFLGELSSDITAATQC